MITTTMIQLLLDAGYTDGWAMENDVLVLWEHNEDPPAPLTRPKNEIPSTDSTTGAE